MTRYEYAGSELPLFAGAHRWKAYWRQWIGPYVGGRVLEVGAGIGANTLALAGLSFDAWTCLEPDRMLADQIPLPTPRHVVQLDTLGQVTGDFDTILYLDVLEHILDDGAELARAAARLATGGRLIVLAPAHAWLESPFDRAVGHHRRYTRASLRAVVPAGLEEILVRYLDAAGLLASLGNKVLLRATMPTQAQIQVWDRWLVPCSRWLDRATFGHAGKSVLGIWRRPD